jgi:hypothetical protein
MKKILILLVLAGIIFAGCTDIKLNSVNQPEKGMYKLIPIPGKAGLSAETVYTTTSIIDGSAGGTMTMNASYLGDDGQQVTLNLTMTIPAGAFSDVRTITLTADDQYAALICSPAMVFDKSLLLDYSYTGLNLKSINIPKVKNGFYFIPDSGNLEQVESTGYLIDKKSGTLAVSGAKINHFSRFGWSTIDGSASM